MITSYHALNVNEEEYPLADILGATSTLNGLIAIVSGVASEFMVNISGTFKAPFLASITCLCFGGYAIWTTWVHLHTPP